MMADQIHADFTTQPYTLTIETEFIGADTELPTLDKPCLYWQDRRCKVRGNKCGFKCKGMAGRVKCDLYEGIPNAI